MGSSRRDFISMSAFLGMQGALLTNSAYGFGNFFTEHGEDEESAYLKSIYAPIDQQVALEGLCVEGKIPAEIHGTYFRNGPNPTHQYRPHHWFDGDGMIHRIEIRDGKVSYRNRFVETQAYLLEKRWGKLFAGLNESSKLSSLGRMALSAILLRHAVKDTSNTDLIYFRDQIISLWWLAGRPYALDPITLAPQGVASFEGYSGNMCAHARIDPRTGELFFLDFSQVRPWVAVVAVTPAGTLNWVRRFDLPAPRVYHDILFTENYVVLMDFPVGIQARLGGGIGLDRNHPARIILVPRDGVSKELVFETNPCYVLHGLNAYEKEGKVFLSVLKFEDPFGLRSQDKDPTIPYVGVLRVQTKPTLWTLDLQSQRLHESTLDDENGEFPRINDDFLGKESRFSYHPRLAPSATAQFVGLTKFDWKLQRKLFLPMPKGMLCEEFVFIKKCAPASEDDGWLATMVHDLESGTNHFAIYDAQSMDAEPVAKIKIPVRVPAGFHSKWVDSP